LTYIAIAQLYSWPIVAGREETQREKRGGRGEGEFVSGIAVQLLRAFINRSLCIDRPPEVEGGGGKGKGGRKLKKI